MVALAKQQMAHDVFDVGTPFYGPLPRPGQLPGPPVLHKFDRDDFVKRYISEVNNAEVGKPASLLGTIAPPPVLDVDTDALDYMGRRFRKLYQPVHFRFYLAACELRCLVPGFPAPSAGKIQKVEFVIRRVALRQDAAPPIKRPKKPKPLPPPVLKVPPTKLGCEGAPTQKNLPPVPPIPECAEPEAPQPHQLIPAPTPPPLAQVVKIDGSDGPFVDTREWAWVEVPDPSLFPAPPPPAALELASRLTGNTHTWWPIPKSEPELEGEERFPMSKVPGLDGKAVFFGYIPTASGEMYGPRQVPLDDSGAIIPQPADPNAPSFPASQVISAAPLVPTSTNFALKPATMRSWMTTDWRGLLGIFNKKSTTGPRPKFESPDLDGTPTAGWAYVIRCVATMEPEPGCVVEQWGPPSEPVLMAPFYDPFGGRPTRVELPSMNTITKLLGGLTPGQTAARGGLPLGISSNQRNPCYPSDLDHSTMKPIEGPGCPKPGTPIELCFWPIFVLTIVANLMINIAIALMIIFNIAFGFFLTLKFCIGLGGNEE